MRTYSKVSIRGYRLHFSNRSNPDVLRAKVSVLIDLYKKNRLLLEQEQKLIAINKSLEKEVAERKNSEEKVKQLNRKLLENIANLESANKDLERFAFMASHDLQEPLRKIRMFSDRLLTKSKSIPDEDAKTHESYSAAAERMQTLIVDILSFSKVSNDKSAFVESDLNAVIKMSLQRWRTRSMLVMRRSRCSHFPCFSCGPPLYASFVP
jgi:light-regulated signal transduction histidine kinase (bacteriophytochrome)